MAFYTNYKCTACGQKCMKDLLVNKTVVFTPLGTRRILKSRSVMFLCPECLEKDEEYNLPPNSGPGTKSEGLERVRGLTNNAG